MPKETSIKRNSRSQHSAKDTFRWTTPDLMVAARPVDAYARPAMSQTAASIENSLRNFTAAGNHWGKIYEKQKEDWQQEGSDMRAAGQELPHDANPNIAAGHRMMDGYLAADLINEDMVSKFDEWKDLEPAEFRQQAEIFLNQATAGKDEFYLKGLAQEMPQVLGGMQNMHRKYRVGKQQDVGRTHIRGTIAKEIKRMNADPVFQGEDGPAKKAAHLRKIFTQAQEMGINGGYYLDRTETTKAIIQTIKPIVEDTGEVELLAPFFLKDPAAGNIRIVDTDAGQIIPDIYAKGMEKRKQLGVDNAYESVRMQFTDTYGKFDPSDAYEALQDPAYYKSLGLDLDGSVKLQNLVWAENTRQIQQQAADREEILRGDLNTAFEKLYPTDAETEPDLEGFIATIQGSKGIQGDASYRLITAAKTKFMGNSGPGFVSMQDKILAGEVTDESDILLRTNIDYDYAAAQQLVWSLNAIKPKATGRSPESGVLKDALTRIGGVLNDRTQQKLQSSLSVDAIYKANFQLKQHYGFYEGKMSAAEYDAKYLDPASKDYILDNIISSNKPTTEEHITHKIKGAMQPKPIDNNGYPIFETVPRQEYPDITNFVIEVGRRRGVVVSKDYAEKIMKSPKHRGWYLHYWETGRMSKKQ